MEIVLFTGLQATGKTSFFGDRFARTHVRISLDVVKTRHREKVLIRTCLELKQPCVVDNTNPTAKDRKKYIDWAKEAGVPVVGYYFRSDIQGAMARNRQRVELDRIPERGVLATYNKLELPELSEGFAKLHYVALSAAGFEVSPWVVATEPDSADEI